MRSLRSLPTRLSLSIGAYVHVVSLFARSTFSFVRKYLTTPAGVDVEQVAAENEELKKRVEELSAQLGELQKKV